MKPSEKIRKIWDEMKKVKRLRESGIAAYDNVEYTMLERKYEEVETLFGHESTLSKAIIFYLDSIQ
jgi:hypothetical protein